MTKLRKLRPTIWMTLVVYLCIVGSGAAMAGWCCYTDGDRNAHHTDGCAHEHAAVPPTHNHSAESNPATETGSLCDCRILPTSAVNSSVPTVSAVAASIWMHGAAYAPCLLHALLDSDMSSVGGRHYPLLSDFKPILFSLQTVFLLI
jgi:hypothetical protein